MGTTRNLTLGQFRELTSNLKPPYITYSNPLTPVSVYMQSDFMHIVLCASSHITLKSGEVQVSISHIQVIKRITRHGKNAFKIICNDYTASNDPVPVEILLKFPD